MRTAPIAVVLCGLLCHGVVTESNAVAAAQAKQPRSFDAVSIRASESSATTGGGMRLLPSGDIRVQRMRLSNLIALANQIDLYRVVNEPAWSNTTYYDIVAKANAQSTRDDTFEMMRTMLRDRFKLVVHRETRPLQGFALVRGSRLAAGLKPSNVNCKENPAGPRCSEGVITGNTLRAFGMPLPNLVQLVAGIMGAPLIDRTNLTGTFDIDLRWSPETSPADDVPVMSTALGEQLGLRLERAQVPTEVLVVDRVERPSEN